MKFKLEDLLKDPAQMALITATAETKEFLDLPDECGLEEFDEYEEDVPFEACTWCNGPMPDGAFMFCGATCTENGIRNY